MGNGTPSGAPVGGCLPRGQGDFIHINAVVVARGVATDADLCVGREGVGPTGDGDRRIVEILWVRLSSSVEFYSCANIGEIESCGDRAFEVS